PVARVCLKLKAGDSAALAMTAPLGGTSSDALAWYGAAAGDRSTTLRQLFALLYGLGMRESSGNCFEGRDRSASNVTADTAEAGLFQQVGIRAAQAPSCPSCSRRILPIRTASCRSSAQAFPAQLRRTKEGARALGFRRCATPAPHLRWKRPGSACAPSVGTGGRSIVAKRRFVRRPRHCCCRCRR